MQYDWSTFHPSQKTLIVIDYVAGRAKETSDTILALSRISASLPHPVRILILEREESSWWATFCREDSLSESAQVMGTQYKEALCVSDLKPDSILEIAKQILTAKGQKWDAAVALKFVYRMAKYNVLSRPLYAMILATHLDGLEVDATPEKLLQTVLQKESERRKGLVANPEELRRMENLLLLSTLMSGIVLTPEGLSLLEKTDIAQLIPNVSLIDQQLYSDISGGSKDSDSLSGLQPDILGELFILNEINSGGIRKTKALRLLRAVWNVAP